MARNTKPWFKLLYRDWMESQRVRRMHPASQGIYLRALCFQAMHGSLPIDEEEIAICLQVKPSFVKKYWPECLQHFEKETTELETVLYNPKQRELLKESADDKEARRRGAEKTNAKRDAENNGNRYAQRTNERAVRASVSDSISKSDDDLKNHSRAPEEKPAKGKKVDHLGYDNSAFCEFMSLWPRKLKRSEAYSAYRKNVKSDEQHQLLMERSRAALQGEFANRKVDKIPYPSSWINGSDWLDAGADLSGSPAKSAPAPVAIEAQPEALPELDQIKPDRWNDMLHRYNLEYPLDFEWIQPLSPLGIDQAGRIYITAPSSFHRNWVAQNYSPYLSRLLQAPIKIIVGDTL